MTEMNEKCPLISRVAARGDALNSLSFNDLGDPLDTLQEGGE